MQLLLIRHAIAELKPEEGGTQPDDTLRELTPKGRKRMKAVARGLRKVHPDIALLASSPLVRAVQTAQIVSSAYKVSVRTVPELAPGAGPKAVLAWLRGLEAVGTVAIVGHEPDLSNLAQHVLGSPRPVLVLKKGGVCLIDLADGDQARLEWLATPRSLREIGS
jgi:phosphohistidine phosphatase